MRLHVDSTFLQVERTLSCKLPQLPYLKAPGHLLNTYVLIMRSFLVEPRRHCQKTCSQEGILSELCFLFCEVTGFAVELNVLEVQWTRSEQSLADCFGAGCWRRGELIFGDLGLLGQKDRLVVLSWHFKGCHLLCRQDECHWGLPKTWVPACRHLHPSINHRSKRSREMYPP